MRWTVADLHAVMLLVLPAAGLIAIAMGARRSPTARQSIAAAAIGLGAMVVCAGSNMHLCLEGVPRTQWLLPGLVLIIAWAAIGRAALRRVVAGSLIIGMLGLSCHFTHLVHQQGWTGNPEWQGTGAAHLSTRQRHFQSLRRDGDEPALGAPTNGPATDSTR
jgi:hypothetical protein